MMANLKTFTVIVTLAIDVEGIDARNAQARAQDLLGVGFRIADEGSCPIISMFTVEGKVHVVHA